MDFFWSDLLELEFPPEDHLIRQCTSNTRQPHVFPEKELLSCPRIVNIHRIDSVFRSLFGGYCPRVPILSPSNAPFDRCLQKQEVWHIISNSTKAVYMPKLNELLPTAFHEFLAAEKEGTRGMKMTILKRMHARMHIHIQDSPAACLEDLIDVPLPIAYVTLFKEMTRSTPTQFFTREAALVRQIIGNEDMDAFYMQQHNLVADNVLQRAQRALWTSESPLEGKQKPPRLTTFQDLASYAIVSDGYFLRRFSDPAVSAWLHVYHSDSKRHIQCKTLVRMFMDTVLPSRFTTLVTESLPCVRRQRIMPLSGMFGTHITLSAGDGANWTVDVKASDAAGCTCTSFSVQDICNAAEKYDDDNYASVWWREMCADTLKSRYMYHHLLFQQSPPDQHNTSPTMLSRYAAISMYHDLVLNFLCSKGLGFHSTPRHLLAPWISNSTAPKKYSRAIVLVDNRDNPWSVASLLCTASTLSRQSVEGGRWGVYVFCGIKNKPYFRDSLAPYFPPHDVLNIVELPELSMRNKFTLEDYNLVMKSSKLWEVIDAEKCLTVQDDGVIMRCGVERYMDHYDYVGAPWREGQKVLADVSCPTLVGNGGVSVRNVAAMTDIARYGEDTLQNNTLFVNGAQPVPEDVYFVAGLHARADKYVICPRDDALGFTAEQTISSSHLDRILGFHKPWAYNSLNSVKQLFDGFLQ